MYLLYFFVILAVPVAISAVIGSYKEIHVYSKKEGGDFLSKNQLPKLTDFFMGIFFLCFLLWSIVKFSNEGAVYFVMASIVYLFIKSIVSLVISSQTNESVGARLFPWIGVIIGSFFFLLWIFGR